MSYPIVAAARKSSQSTIASTGACPADWRRWWQHESERVGTDWQSLLAASGAALSRLSAMHLSRASS
jgi:hypothetical protein